MREGRPKGWVPDMAQPQTYYQYDFHKRLTWWFTREEIGQGLREHYAVPKELPPKLLTLVRKLDAVESNWSHLRGLSRRLDAIEGKCLSRYAQTVEPRGLAPSDDWSLCCT